MRYFVDVYISKHSDGVCLSDNLDITIAQELRIEKIDINISQFIPPLGIFSYSE